MRCVIYAATDAAGNPDWSTAIWDRQVQADIDKRHLPNAIGVVHGGVASWSDYSPVAIVTSSGYFNDDLLCCGGTGFTAIDVLEKHDPDIDVRYLTARGRMGGGT